MPNFLTDGDVLALRAAHRKQKDKKLADRIKAVLMLNDGFTYPEIVKALLLDEVTLRRYLKKFQKKGVLGLTELHYMGHITKLTTLQEIELKKYLSINTKRTSKEIADYVFETYKIKFSVIGITKLLHRLGFSYKKPKVVPGKADKLKQDIFVEEYKRLKKALKLTDQIYFADSTHPEHNTKPSCGWILKGKINDKFVKTNTGRERLNLTGAMSLNNKNGVFLEQKTINSDSIIKLFRKLLISQPKGKIYLILDNAPYHHSKKVKFWLKSHTRRIKLVFLPSYSPNLNIIERLWKFFHQKITWNHYFETFKEFRNQTLRFFKNLDKYKPELDTLLTDNFQLLPT
jgi:transposase